MPAIGDKYTKGEKTCEITSVTAERIKYMIHPDAGEVSVTPAEFELYAARSIERGAVFEPAGCDEMNDEAFL